MFLLNFLPDWIFYASTFVGIIGTVLLILFGKLIPVQYKLGLQITFVFLLAIGLFFIGAISNEESWQLKVKEMEVKVAQQELAASEITTEVITKYIDRVKIVEGKTHEIIKKVPVYITFEPISATPIFVLPPFTIAPLDIPPIDLSPIAPVTPSPVTPSPVEAPVDGGGGSGGGGGGSIPGFN